MIKSTLAVAAVLLSTGLAYAQSTPPQAAEGPARQAMAACRADAASLCGGVEKGGGRKIACLKENQAKLSPACQSAIQTVLNRRLDRQAGQGGKGGGKAMQACQADVATFCQGIEPGRGGIGKCLKENASKLSPGCQQAWQERKASRVTKKEAKAACAADRATLCGGIEKGRAAFACLKEKQAQASPACQQALASLPTRGKQAN